jgi:NitT/TauT family transport system substrate-binding protein
MSIIRGVDAPTSAARRRRQTLRVSATLTAGAMLAATALSACSSATAQNGGGANKPLTNVTLQLSWSMIGGFAPTVLAQQNGYYKAQGLNVSIQQGNGSQTAEELVATGKATFAFADAGIMAQLVSKGAPIKMVANFQQAGTLGFAYRPAQKIASPSDLLTTPVISSSAGNGPVALKALAAKEGLDYSNIHQVLVASTEYVQAFESNTSAVLEGNINSDFQTIKERTPAASFVPLSTWGIILMSQGIIASNATLKNDPELVRKFVYATIQGFEAAEKNPHAAITAAAQAFPEVVKPIETSQYNELISSLQVIQTPNSKGHTYGWMAPADTGNMLQILHQYGGLAGSTSSADYFTDALLPASNPPVPSA